MRDNVKIPTIYFCCKWIYSKPASFGVVNYKIFICFHRFLICEAGALKRIRILSFYSFWSFEYRCDFGHLLKGKVQLFLKISLEILLSEVVIVLFLLKLIVSLVEFLGGEWGSLHLSWKLEIVLTIVVGIEIVHHLNLLRNHLIAVLNILYFANFRATFDDNFTLQFSKSSKTC